MPDTTHPRADLAVVIVSYGSAHLLPACLRTLYGAAARDGLTLDVVIADNDERTPAAPLVADAFPQARVVEIENRGFGHGNNAAYALTDAAQVMFINPDTEIRGGSLSSLLARMDEEPRIGLLGCRQVEPDGTLTPTIRRAPGIGRALADAIGTERLLGRRSPGQRVLDPGAYTTETECGWTSGSFMLTRRAALQSLEGAPFDERFFLFSEEVDLCRRLRDAGWSVRHSPRLEIMHYTNRAGVNGRLAAQEAFSRRQYAEKHFGIARRAVYLALTAAGYALRGGLSRRRRPVCDSRAGAATQSLRTLRGLDPPPFGELS